MKKTDKQSEPRRLKPLAVGVAVLTLGVCAMAVCVWLGGGGWFGGGWRLAGVWASGQFRLFACVAFGSLAVLSVLAGWLIRVARKAQVARGRALGSQDGTAILEFALVLPIALGIVLLMIQASLLMGGFLCVNYAGYCAARAAVTFVPDDLDDEPANIVADYYDPEASEKLSRMQQAAIWAVMPVSDGGYDEWSVYSDTLAEGIDDLYSQSGEQTPGWVNGYLGRKLAYAEQNTSVALTPPANGVQYTAHEDLRVVAKHNLYLSVPYASRVLAALDANEAVDFGEGRYALRVEIPCTLRNEGITDTIDLHPDMEEIEEHW